MKKLLKQIAQLEKIAAELEPDAAERKAYNTQLHDYTEAFITTLKERPAYTKGDANAQKLAVKKTTQPFSKLLETYTKEVVEKGIVASSGGHVGYIPGGGIFTSALADYIVDITNEYAGIHYGSPGAVTLENELVNWLKSLFKFPENAVGNLASGGSIANLTALTAARDKHQIKNEKITKSVVYLSPQVHHCIHKALRIIGLEDVIVRHVDLDKHHKIDTEKLEHLIKTDLNSGLNPFLIVASSGTTDTGAVDPLDTLGDISKKYNLWLHIDGAYGGFFILVDSKKELFKGIEKADSLVIDPHKSLFLPYGLGAVLIKDKSAVYHSNHYFANYMQDAFNEAIVNPADVSPELTKHFRGLRLWLPLQLHGIAPFKAALEEKLLLTTYFRKLLTASGFEIGPKPDLSVSYFWYPSQSINQNTFNKKLLEYIHDDGTVFLSSTVLDDKFVIRIAILSFRTKKETIDKAMIMINKCLLQAKDYFNK
ncbi:MAG TPA: aminotransferase class I/II-fold pyridoxal phosphate-dependent enzyme [Flavobacteriia bacterium]|nr:aminotransferase class I/II-fold pyridoxal phosphate-dependent enzyme [Flavobacteriia bacterium]